MTINGEIEQRTNITHRNGTPAVAASFTSPLDADIKIDNTPVINPTPKVTMERTLSSILSVIIVVHPLV